MIELGLSRIASLLKHTKLPWRAIHVAGTNGKGSICTAVSAMLARAGVSHGRFTSPHLIDRWDCIALNGAAVSESVFREVEDAVSRRNTEQGINASEFELLTATAFEIFTREKVEMGVIETGMGGRLDATNVLEKPLVTVISKIGLDHQGFLGDTIEQIAAEKAGILKPSVPCVVDATNMPSVLAVIQNRARQINAGPVHLVESADFFSDPPSDHEPHELLNLGCAQLATKLALQHTGRPLSQSGQPIVLNPLGIQTPGRQQTISITPLVPTRKHPIIIDGAHNPDSALALSRFVARARSHSKRVVWLLAATHGKDIDSMLRVLLQPGDAVVAVEFGPVDGMPWVRATPASEILAAVERAVPGVGERVACGRDLLGALERAAGLAGERTVVVAGSLYLVSDFFRLLRKRGSGGVGGS